MMTKLLHSCRWIPPALAFLWLLVSCGGPSDIIGTWQQRGQTATLKFTDHNFTAVDNQGMTVTGDYLLEANGTIRFFIKHPDGETEIIVARISRQDQELTITFGNGQETEIYRRQNPAP
jgi:hypothetical protein